MTFGQPIECVTLTAILIDGCAIPAGETVEIEPAMLRRLLKLGYVETVADAHRRVEVAARKAEIDAEAQAAGDAARAKALADLEAAEELAEVEAAESKPPPKPKPSEPR